MLASASPQPDSPGRNRIKHDDTLPSNAFYLLATECLPRRPDEALGRMVACVDLSDPLSVSGSASYFRDCDALGIPRHEAVSGFAPSQRRFSFGKTI